MCSCEQPAAKHRVAGRSPRQDHSVFFQLPLIFCKVSVNCAFAFNLFRRLTSSLPVGGSDTTTLLHSFVEAV